jgi:hypothetical protein
MAAILTNGVLKTRTAPIFQPLLAPARYQGSGSTKARDVPPPMPRIVRPGGRQHRLELATQRQTAALREVHCNASVHTDAANPPAPGSPHIAHIGPTFSASPKKSQGKIARGGPRDRNAFPSATPPPGRPAPRPECFSICHSPSRSARRSSSPRNWRKNDYLFASCLQ